MVPQKRHWVFSEKKRSSGGPNPGEFGMAHTLWSTGVMQPLVMGPHLRQILE